MLKSEFISAEPRMQQWEDSPRFRALHKAVGKMGWTAPDDADAAPHNESAAGVFHACAESLEPASPEAFDPALRARPVVSEGMPTTWVLADSMADSAVRRAQRMARLRAERELVYERARMEDTINRMHLTRIESSLRDSRAAVMAMEDRLRTSGQLSSR
jgi:hypothetical protein